MQKRIIQELKHICRILSVDTLPEILVNPLPPSADAQKAIPEKDKAHFFRSESHKYYEIAIQVSGTSIFHYGKADYRIHKHQVFVVDRDVQHCLGIPPQKERAVILWIAATADTIRPGVSTYEDGERRKVWAQDIFAPGGYLIREIVREIESGSPDAADTITIYLLTFLTMMMKELIFVGKIQDSGRKTAIVRQVQSYVSTHLSDPLTLEELSRLTSVSPNYLCKIFKQIAGETVFSYIQDMRIRMATDYLISTDQAVSEISEKLGFYDQFHFSRTFKTYMGMSPTEYRAACLRRPEQSS